MPMDLKKKLLLWIHNNLRELNDTILECDDLWLSQVRTLRTDIYDIQKLIEDPKGAAMNFVYGQLASIKTQAFDFFKKGFNL